MEILKASQMAGGGCLVTVKDNIHFNISDKVALINTLILAYNKGVYSLQEVEISREQSDMFRYTSYEIEDIKSKNQNMIDEINQQINIEMKNCFIIPRGYFLLNGKYYKVTNIKDIVSLESQLSANELNMHCEKIQYGLGLRLNNDGGLLKDELKTVTDILRSFQNKDMTFKEFIDLLK